jgi:hypothetical protein
MARAGRIGTRSRVPRERPLSIRIADEGSQSVSLLLIIRSTSPVTGNKSTSIAAMAAQSSVSSKRRFAGCAHSAPGIGYVLRANDIRPGLARRWMRSGRRSSGCEKGVLEVGGSPDCPLSRRMGTTSPKIFYARGRKKSVRGTPIWSPVTHQSERRRSWVFA